MGRGKGQALKKTTRVLILSFYAPPDLSAGSFRIGALLDAAKDLGDSVTIDCLSTMPNRYHNYEKRADPFSKHANVSIHRVHLPKHKNDLLGQIRAYTTYVVFVENYLRKTDKEYDIIFATSSRLMTALLGAFHSWRKKKPLYLDIRDLFTDTAADVFKSAIMKLAHPFLSVLERWAFNHASKINVVSEGFCNFVRLRAPETPVGFIPNGVDEQFLTPIRYSPPEKKLKILYAGNIGEGQGLELTIPQTAKKLSGIVDFKIVGGGGRLVALTDALKKEQVNNVQIALPVSRDDLRSLYEDCDVLFLQLNRYKAFEKVLPSKLFEYAASNKPIIACVDGYAAQFVREQIKGAIVVPPCDVQALCDAIHSVRALAEVPIDRSTFVNKYNRRGLSSALLSDVLTYACNSNHVFSQTTATSNIETNLK